MHHETSSPTNRLQQANNNLTSAAQYNFRVHQQDLTLLSAPHS